MRFFVFYGQYRFTLIYPLIGEKRQGMSHTGECVRSLTVRIDALTNNSADLLTTVGDHLLSD